MGLRDDGEVSKLPRGNPWLGQPNGRHPLAKRGMVPHPRQVRQRQPSERRHSSPIFGGFMHPALLLQRGHSFRYYGLHYGRTAVVTPKALKARH
jgi:hypothetical protein